MTTTALRRTGQQFFLATIDKAGGQTLTWQDIDRVSLRVFNHALGQVYAMQHLAGVVGEIRPLVTLTLQLLEATEIKRQGSIGAVIRFCREHQFSENVRAEYLDAVEKQFPPLAPLTDEAQGGNPSLALAVQAMKSELPSDDDLPILFDHMAQDFRTNAEWTRCLEIINAAMAKLRQHWVPALMYLGFFELAEALGAKEIKDPWFPQLSGTYIFSVSSGHFEKICARRLKLGIVTIDDLHAKVPNLAYIQPGSRHFAELYNLHPEITGPGIYYHRHLEQKIPQLESRKLLIMFHELMEAGLAAEDIKDPAFEKYCSHCHPIILVAEIFLAILLGDQVLDQTIADRKREMANRETELANEQKMAIEYIDFLLGDPSYDAARRLYETDAQLRIERMEQVLKTIGALKKLLLFVQDPEFKRKVRERFTQKLMANNPRPMLLP